MNDKTPTYDPNGPVRTFFGLDRASYQVVPRGLAQSMPHEWQARFVACMEELEAAFGYLAIPDDVTYDVRPALPVYVSELTDEQRQVVGVTCEWDEDLEGDVYFDRDGIELGDYECVMVPVLDPLPSYSWGRTRVLRADQLAPAGGGSR